jgi:putative oxidoreductase
MTDENNDGRINDQDQYAGPRNVDRPRAHERAVHLGWLRQTPRAAPTQAYFAKLGLPVPMLAWGLTVVIEFIGGLALLLGVQARVVGTILAAWCIATALVAHTDFADRNMQIHFLKNVIMAGGFLYVAAYGAGAYTIQQIFGRRARVT